MVTLHEVITFLVSMQISISSLQTHNVNRCGRSRHLARKLSLRDRKSGSAGMPRPISYAVFCLKKKNTSQVLVIWKARNYCTLLVMLDTDRIAKWAKPAPIAASSSAD